MCIGLNSDWSLVTSTPTIFVRSSGCQSAHSDSGAVKMLEPTHVGGYVIHLLATWEAKKILDTVRKWAYQKSVGKSGLQSAVCWGCFLWDFWVLFKMNQFQMA